MSCNVVEGYAEFTRKNFLMYAKKIMGKYFDKELFEKYMDTYINIRYYNQVVSIRTTLEANLNHYLNEVYSKNDNKTSKFMLELLKMFYYLDDIKKFNYDKDLGKYSKEIEDIRESKLGIVDKDFVKKFTSMVLDNKKRIDKYINSFDSKDFYLDISDVGSKNVYNVNLLYNVVIPKLYSSYAINKVWNSVLISEDSLQICYYLVNQKILNEVIKGNFDNNYIVPFKTSLFLKKEKIKRVLEIMNNDIARDLISLRIKYEDFSKNKDDIYKLIKDGYQFSVVLDDYFLKNVKDIGILDNFKYIIIVDSKYKISRLREKRNIVYL